MFITFKTETIKKLLLFTNYSLPFITIIIIIPTKMTIRTVIKKSHKMVCSCHNIKIIINFLNDKKNLFFYVSSNEI